MGFNPWYSTMDLSSYAVMFDWIKWHYVFVYIKIQFP